MSSPVEIESASVTRKSYAKPEIVHELVLETRAGSPVGDPLSDPAVNPFLNNQ